MNGLQYIGVWVLAAWAFNMWAWLSVMGSGAGLVSKAIWTLILVCLPGLGFIAWYLLGPRAARA